MINELLILLLVKRLQYLSYNNRKFLVLTASIVNYNLTRRFDFLSALARSRNVGLSFTILAIRTRKFANYFSQE